MARIDGRTKIVFLCNPNNPTGTYWTATELEDFLDRVDGRVVVVVDEAYAEYMDADDYPDMRFLLRRHANLVVFRTFSKAYGLAGLRIGYLVGGPRLADVVRRATIVYSVNAMAQKAALAALEDGEDHIRASRDLTQKARFYVEAAVVELDLSIVSHHGNFLMLRLPMDDMLAYHRLMERGFMVRSMTDFRFPNWIRLSLSHLDIMAGFMDALADVLSASKTG